MTLGATLEAVTDPWTRTLALTCCIALVAPGCLTRDDRDGAEGINPQVVVMTDTLAPEVIESVLAARLAGTSRGRVFCAYTPLGQEVNWIAVWALCEELVAFGDSVESGTASSGPVLLVLDTARATDGARIAEVRVPRDGNLWSRDVGTIFSEEVVARIHEPTAAQNRRLQGLIARNRQAALAHHAQAASQPPAYPDTACAATEPATTTGSRTVWVHFACESPAAVPGQLYRAYRHVDAGVDPVEAALRELVRGPTPAERANGLRSFFSARTADALRSVTRTPRGDTVSIDFAPDFPSRLPKNAGVTSFLPPGVMAEITGTVFAQFGEVHAMRFQFDGSERAFWQWLKGQPRAYTRKDWERI